MNYRDYWLEPDNKLEFLRGTDISAYFGQLMDVMKQFITKRLSDIEIDPSTTLLSQRMAVNERMMRTPRNILNSPRPILYINGSLIDNVSYQGAMSANQFLGDRQYKNIDAIGTMLFYKNDYTVLDDNSRNKALYLIPYSYKFNFEFTIIVDTLYYARNVANDLSTIFTEENTDCINIKLVSFLSKRSYRKIVTAYGIDVENIDACRAFIDEISPYEIYIRKNPGTGANELAFVMEHSVNLLPRAEIESSSTPVDGKYPIRFGMDLEINLPRDYVFKTFRPYRAPITLETGTDMPAIIMTKRENYGTYRKLTEISWSVVNDATDYVIDLKQLESYFLAGQVPEVLLITDRLDEVIALLNGDTKSLFSARITYNGEELYYGKLVTFNLPTTIKKDEAVLVEFYMDFALYKNTYSKLPRAGKYKATDVLF